MEINETGNKTEHLVYSASNLNLPIVFINDTRKKLFCWKNKKDKSKENVYIKIREREEFVCLTLISC